MKLVGQPPHKTVRVTKHEIRQTQRSRRYWLRRLRKARTVNRKANP